jgi:hypothetical protein
VRRLPGTIQETADEVTGVGGVGIAVACDDADDSKSIASSNESQPITNTSISW